MAKRLSRRERIFVAAGLAAALLFFSGRFLMNHVITYESEFDSLLSDKLEVLTAYQDAVSREAALKQEGTDLDRVLAAYQAFLLPGATPPLAAAELQTRLKAMGAESGLKIVSEKILSHRERGTYLEIPVQIVASGQIGNLRDFIVALEHAELFIGIEELNLRAIKRKQFVPSSRTYTEMSEIQATFTVAGLIPAAG